MIDPRQENQSSACPPFEENSEVHQKTDQQDSQERAGAVRRNSFSKENEPEAYTSSPLLSHSVFFEVLPSKRQYGRMVLSLFFSLGMLGLFIFAGFGIYFIATGGRTFYNGVPTEAVNSSYTSSKVQTGEAETETVEGGTVDAPILQPPVVTGPTVQIVVERRSEETELHVEDQGEETPLSTVEIAQKILPSVASIVTYQENETEPLSQGSGLIFSQDGYIITNAHVVSGADGVNVVLYNGEQYEGVVIGVDNRTDIAVLKIQAQNLYSAVFGDSEQLQVGEDVVAVGNPGGLELAGSVTRGIVSAVNRPVRTSFSSGYTVQCIQTDAAINPGNSGGPLVDSYGRVMGINSSKIATVDYEGIGFSIPSNTVLPVVQELVRYGRVTGRVWLGIGAMEVNEVLAKLNDLPAGIMISTIYPESNLSQAGVQQGDVLMEVENQPVTTLDELREVLDQKKPGQKATLTLYRPQGEGVEGKIYQVTVYLLEDTESRLGTTIP